MSDQNQDNLKKLFATFYDAEQIENCIEDFRKVEEIFSDYPAPEPDEMVIANIKAEMAMSLAGRKAKRFRRILYEAAGIAAAIVILAAFGLQLFEKNDVQPQNGVYRASILPTAIWESDNIAVDDVDLVIYTTEIEQIEYEIHTLQSGEETRENESTVIELEMELEEINSDFWKG